MEMSVDASNIEKSIEFIAGYTIKANQFLQNARAPLSCVINGKKVKAFLKIVSWAEVHCQEMAAMVNIPYHDQNFTSRKPLFTFILGIFVDA